MTTMATMNVKVVRIISLTAPTGLSLSRDMMRPPAKPPSAPANADDSAEHDMSQGKNDNYIIYWIATGQLKMSLVIAHCGIRPRVVRK